MKTKLTKNYFWIIGGGLLQVPLIDEANKLGYDIKSFNADGSTRWIEVKTTKQGRSTPFYISKNELECSEDRPDKYYLYRVYESKKSPKFYTLQGDLFKKCHLEPINYRAKAK